MNTIFSQISWIAGVTAFSVLVLLQSVYWVYMWQLKEYRIDRFRDYLTTRSGRKLLTHWIYALQWILFVLFVFQLLSVDTGIELTRYGLPYIIPVASFVFGMYVVVAIAQYWRWSLFPKRTGRSMLLAAMSISVVLVLSGAVVAISEDLAETLASSFAVLLSIPYIVLVCNALITPFADHQKKKIIARAKARIQEVNPTVIGITGSYGKSTAKEYISTILGQQYQVFTPPSHVNTDIGVANAILAGLKDTHTIAVIEMGAYRMGEIEAICDMVSPIIGVLTGIGDQHISLFGSQENIVRGKSELLHALPSSGVAFVNKDSSYAASAGVHLPVETRFFSTHTQAHIQASEIVATPYALNAVIHVGKEAIQISPNLAGAQALPAILAAVGIAQYFHMDMKEVAKTINTLKPLEGSMHVYIGKNKCMVIDDHYNTSTTSFTAALDFLDSFPQPKKIVITPGIEELGSHAYEEHKHIGNHISQRANFCIVTKKDFAQGIIDGAVEGGMERTQVVVSNKKVAAVKRALSVVDEHTVILVEGRVSSAILSLIAEPS